MADRGSHRRTRVADILWIVAGAAVCSVGLVAFTIPNKIASGGLSGLATVLYYAAGLPVGAVVLGGNALLLLLQWRVVGPRSIGKSVLGIGVMSALIEYLMRGLQVPALVNDPLLACLYGGILGGVGVGMVFRGGGTTGGTDIVAQVIHRQYRVPVGEAILVTNFLVTVAAGFVFGPELALYGLITVFFSGRVVDIVLEGMSVNRLAFVISDQADVIAQGIIEEIRRGATSVDVRGSYTGSERQMLLVALRRNEVPLLRRLVNSLDPTAFVIVTDARQILGKGFVSLSAEVAREEES